MRSSAARTPRRGGDEFAILEDASAEKAEEVARRILDALRQPFVAARQIFVSSNKVLGCARH